MTDQPIPDPEQKAINLARQALTLAREIMLDAPPAIDPMTSVHAAKWREIRDQLNDLERGGPLKQLFAQTRAQTAR